MTETVTNGEPKRRTRAPAAEATPEPEKPAPLTLAAKLAVIMGELGSIPKAGENKAQNYRFARESDVAEAVSKLLAQHHIWIHQSVLKFRRKLLYVTQSGLNMMMTTVVMEFYFIDGDSGEVGPTRIFPGTGADTGDKGVYKAMTGAEKYFLMKSFLISTGDDPEADEKTDKAAAAAGAATSGPRVVAGRQPARRGGKSEESDRATTAQIGEIAKIAREKKLDAEDTVERIVKLLAVAEPAEEETVRSWLAKLSAEQAAKVVEMLSAIEPETAESSTDTTTTEAEVVDSASTAADETGETGTVPVV